MHTTESFSYYQDFSVRGVKKISQLKCFVMYKLIVCALHCTHFFSLHFFFFDHFRVFEILNIFFQELIFLFRWTLPDWFTLVLHQGYTKFNIKHTKYQI